MSQSASRTNDTAPAAHDDKPSRPLTGISAWIAAGVALCLAGLALYWTQFPIGTTIYRAAFLALVLTLAFLMFPLWPKGSARNSVSPLDWLLIAVSLAALIYLVLTIEETKTRATRPLDIEVALGLGLIFCILEATRRTTGWVLPAITALFLTYALAGPYMPEPLDHRGYSVKRIVGQNYLTLEGIFSTPLDVAATFIVLFTIYGAVLDRSGAGRFFIDWAFAAFGRRASPAAPGRAVVASGFLLGSVSGSGVATTVTLASLSWPMLQKGGFNPNAAGGLLAAAGIGAIISPPTLGAAAFIIAEYLEVSYGQILLMALVPTVLYYLSAWAMLEADARRMRLAPIAISTETISSLTASQGYHFLSLFVIAGLLALGYSAFMAVFWSIAVAFALSLIRPETRLSPLPAAGFGIAFGTVYWLAFDSRISEAALVALGFALLAALVATDNGMFKRMPSRESLGENRFAAALIAGARDVVGVAATCACAGIIVSVITLTGLGLKISGLIVDAGLGSLFFTILLAAIAMWILGTAVPVTASYIIGAVTLAPALTDAGVALPAAHMFLFYYAVLGDVSPPTALAPFAAAAVTRGNPLMTMLHAWRYCLPAFVAPFMFCLTPEGTGLLLLGDPYTAVLTISTAVLGVFAMASGFGGWIWREAEAIERIVMVLSGICLMYAAAGADVFGAVLAALAVLAHAVRLAIRPEEKGAS